MAGLKLLGVLHGSQEPASSVLVPRPWTPTCCTVHCSRQTHRQTDIRPAPLPRPTAGGNGYTTARGGSRGTAGPDSVGWSTNRSVSWGQLHQPLGFCRIQNHNMNGMAVQPPANPLPAPCKPTASSPNDWIKRVYINYLNYQSCLIAFQSTFFTRNIFWKFLMHLKPLRSFVCAELQGAYKARSSLSAGEILAYWVGTQATREPAENDLEVLLHYTLLPILLLALNLLPKVKFTHFF